MVVRLQDQRSASLERMTAVRERDECLSHAGEDVVRTSVGGAAACRVENERGDDWTKNECGGGGGGWRGRSESGSEK